MFAGHSCGDNQSPKSIAHMQIKPTQKRIGQSEERTNSNTNARRHHDGRRKRYERWENTQENLFKFARFVKKDTPKESMQRSYGGLPPPTRLTKLLRKG